VAELEAIQRALLFAGETGASLHVVHISTGRGVALAAETRAKGVDVSAETCAHYLNFTDEDVERLGAALSSREGIDRICDLRVDDHHEPIAELRRLLTLWRRREDERAASSR
jgi:hypothetical protein